MLRDAGAEHDWHCWARRPEGVLRQRGRLTCAQVHGRLDGSASHSPHGSAPPAEPRQHSMTKQRSDKALIHPPPSGAVEPKGSFLNRLRPKGLPGPAPGQYRFGPLWWIIFAIVMVWNIWSFLPTQTSQVALPYSAFVGQVAGGNVSAVRIVGDQITGTFVQAIVWPEPAKAAGATQAEEKPPTADQQKAGGERKPATYSTFRTAFPGVVGDASLMPLLDAHHVVTDVATPSPSWFAFLLTNGLPVVLVVLLIVWMGRQAARSQAGVFGFGRHRARRYTEDRPKATFADVAGADEAKADLSEVVDILRHPQKYLELGARLPRGVLLVGPPGTGKTLLARAVAGEAGVPFFSISGSEFVEMFVGVGASRVRDLFDQAKRNAPCIIFVDEIDAVGRRRGFGLGGGNDEREQTLNQILVEMDGFEPTVEVIVLAATNRPDVLDPALLRPGRFDRRVMVDLPDLTGRIAILEVHAKGKPLAPDVELATIAGETPGFSGADIANLLNEAALLAARGGESQITMADLEAAAERVTLGPERRSRVLSARDKAVTAYHEAGHALVARMVPHADPVHK